MPNLHITEFERLVPPGSVGGQAPAVTLPPIANKLVAIAGASAQSTAISGNAPLVRLHAEAACHVAVGKNPTATTDHMRMAAGQTEYFGINPGDKIAVIAAA